MRVALVIYGSLDLVSGGYLYDRQLVRRLETEGDEVDILTLPHRSYAGNLLDNYSSELQAAMNGGYDLILQDELNHPSLAWANGRLGSGRPPLVAIVHHLRSCEARPGWQNALYRAVETRYLRSVDACVYNSQTTRHAVEELVGNVRPHVVARPGGDRLQPEVSADIVFDRACTEPLRVQFTGAIIPRKGLHTLIEALSQVASEWRLTVTGNPAADPPYARHVRSLVEGLDLGDRVSWRGIVSNAELAAEMADAHVLAVPSDYEGFGIVYVEAMGFGLPCLATTAGAAGELITHGENGFLIQPGDSRALAGHLQRMASDRELLARMSMAALARYAGHPTWAESTGAIRDFLVSVATRKVRA